MNSVSSNFRRVTKTTLQVVDRAQGNVDPRRIEGSFLREFHLALNSSGIYQCSEKNVERSVTILSVDFVDFKFIVFLVSKMLCLQFSSI